MVTFLPFPGYRPNIAPGEHIGDRISPPYDVIGPEQLKELQSHPHNITNLTLKPDADKRYASSRKLLDAWIADGSLKQDRDSFYLYEQCFDSDGKSYRRRGIVGILKTEPYEDGNVIPHEETFSKVKADRLNLLRDMEAHLESIFGIYEGLTPELNRKVVDESHLVYRYVDSDGVEHRYSRISDPEITSQVTEQLSKQKMLIADGHHRYETALNFSRENAGDEKKSFVLATLVAADDEGLVIRPTHRLVDSGNISEKNAIKGISKVLNLTEVDRSELESVLPDHMMGLVFRSGACYVADCETDPSEPMTSLDTYVAQERILKGVYKSDEGKAEISFDADLESVMDAMESKKHDLAIVFNPPSLKTIWDLSMVGKRMPKKTTFFYPKIWSGFAIYRMV